MIPQNFLKDLAIQHGVSDSELEALSRAVAGQETKAIATELKISPDAVRQRLSQVYHKFNVPGSGPVKLKNLLQLLVFRYQQPTRSVSDTTSHLVKPDTASLSPRLDMDTAPDASMFFGRIEERKKLEEWIIHDRCRFLLLQGMSGIGKTALAVKLAYEIKDNFDVVMWRTLRNAPPLKELLADLMDFLSQPEETNLPATVDGLIEYLCHHRCFVILDNVESIMESGQLAGRYRKEHEDYGYLFTKLGEVPHISCILIASREKPSWIDSLSGDKQPVRTFPLTHLHPEEAWEIFKAKDLSEADGWETLVQRYRGNPLQLKIVASMIQEVFDGKISAFLKYSPLLFGEISELLNEQFERLSPDEKEVMYLLAIQHKPVSFPQLEEGISIPISSTKILLALQSLGRRSLLEKISQEGEIFFTLHPEIMEYVRDKISENIFQEIDSVIIHQNPDSFNFFMEHSLIDANHENPGDNLLGAKLIMEDVRTRLIEKFRQKSLVAEQLKHIISLLPDKPASTVGYTRENAQTLLAVVEQDISRVDVSF